jgi:hypothetical protein
VLKIFVEFTFLISNLVLNFFFYLKFRRENSCCPFMNLAAQIIKRAAQKNKLAVRNK